MASGAVSKALAASRPSANGFQCPAFARERPQGRLADPPPAGDEARGSKLPCGSLDGAESERPASREVDERVRDETV